MKYVMILIWSLNAHATKFNLDRPPFYTMTFGEVERLRLPYYDKKNDQLENYLKETYALLRQIQLKATDRPVIGGTYSTFEELAQSASSWNALREKVFTICEAAKTGPNHRVCENLLQTRQKTFLIYSRPSKEPT